MKNIIYLGYYDVPGNAHEERNFVMSAVNKMNYICSTIKRNGYNIRLLSASGTKKKKNCICKGKNIVVEDGINLKLLSCFGSHSRIIRLFSIVFIKIQLFFELLFSTKKGEPILVYHSIGYMDLLRFLHKIKKFRLFLEIEEIYSDVSNDKITKKRELSFFRSVDGYLFSTELLNRKINIDNKPYAIVYGTYKTENDIIENESAFQNNEKIHCVYAGTFDPRKGGAQSAVLAASYLPSNYHIHIIGFGSKNDVESITELIKTTSQNSESTVTYDGLLFGEDYVRFLNSCHIGLSTQIPEGIYNETSFPSKVLSYMANGLRVVSVRIKVLEESMIGNLICYYDNDSPKDIADAIIDIDITDGYDSKKALYRLDENFVRDIGVLFE